MSLPSTPAATPASTPPENRLHVRPGEDVRAELDYNRFNFVDEMMDRLFGKRPSGSGAEYNEVQKTLDRLSLLEGYEKQKLIIRTVLTRVGEQQFQALAEKLRQEEATRDATRREFQDLRTDMLQFAGAMGEHFRKLNPAGQKETAEEDETILMRNFITQLGQLTVEEIGDVISIAGDDIDIIDMLAELQQTNNGPLLGLMSKESGVNFENLRNFAEQIYSAHLSKTKKSVEASILGAIVMRMSVEQRGRFFEQFFKQGQGGIEKGNVIMLDLIRTGNLTWHDVQLFMRGDIKDIYGATNLPTLETEAKKAEAEFQKMKDALQVNVEYVQRRFHRNPVLHVLSRKGLLLGVLPTVLGAATALTSALSDIFIGVESEKGWWKIRGAVSGLASTFMNHYTLGGLAVSGLGLNALTKGSVREKLLHSPTKEARQMAFDRRLGDQLRRDFFGPRPGLTKYFMGKGAVGETIIDPHYEDLLSRARQNEAMGKGYSLNIDTDADIPLTDKDLQALGVSIPTDPAVRKAAEKETRYDIREAFLILSKGLNKRGLDDLDGFFFAQGYYGQLPPKL